MITPEENVFPKPTYEELLWYIRHKEHAAFNRLNGCNVVDTSDWYRARAVDDWMRYEEFLAYKARQAEKLKDSESYRHPRRRTRLVIMPPLQNVDVEFVVEEPEMVIRGCSALEGAIRAQRGYRDTPGVSTTRQLRYKS